MASGAAGSWKSRAPQGPRIDGAVSVDHRLLVVFRTGAGAVRFSDAPALRWRGDGLTTIGLPVEDIASAAMDCLMRRAERRDHRPQQPMHVMHRPTLIQRASTAPPPRILRRA